MIDTIIINIPRSKARMLSGEHWDLVAKQDFYSKFARNPTKRQKESGKYYPRLTGVQRAGSESIVKIEFSIPKLLYLNNLDELEEKDFKEVIHTLHERLKDMNLLIFEKDLVNADVSAVHYSKNIVLTSGYTAKHIISELQKINLNKMNDLTKTRFMNSGESLQGYSISNSFVFYDKISDLKKDEKRAVDRDQNPYQRSLFSSLKDEEILRFEVRLSQKRKLNTLFKQYGFKTNPTFQEAFSLEKALKVMTEYWNEKIDKNKYVLFTYSENSESLLKKISIARPKSRPQTLLSLLGLVSFVKDNKGGLRELRTILTARITDRAWYSIVKNLKSISKDLESLSELDWYQEVSKQIKDYKPYKTKKLLKA